MLTRCLSKPKLLTFGILYAQHLCPSPGHIRFLCLRACTVLTFPSLLRFAVTFLGRVYYKKLRHPHIYHSLATTHHSDHNFSPPVNHYGNLISSCLSKYTMGKNRKEFCAFTV